MARAKSDGAIPSRLRNLGLVRIAVLAVAGLPGAWFAFLLAVSGVTRTTNPQLALTFMPDESTALAARAEELFLAKPEQPSPDVRAMALAALRQQAINPKALRLLGFVADSHGDPVKAEAYMRLAEKLTRRDPGAQLWLVESSARKGDTKQTLVHYDIALRTAPNTQPLLFPQLLGALEDAEIRAALKPYVRAKQSWAAGFMSYANANSKDLPSLTSLYLESGGMVDPKEDRDQRYQLISRLINEKYFSDASRLYRVMPGAAKARLTDIGFDAQDRDGGAGPMGWQILDDPDAGGGFGGDDKGQRANLSVFANSSTTRPVATKLLYLAPGPFLFSARLVALDRGEGGFLRWQMLCPSRESSVPFWTFDTISVSTRVALAIPSDCPVQRIELVVSGGQGQTGLEATIANIAISRRAN